MKLTTDTVVIPGELKLKNPATPPVTVSLPIVARPSEVWNYLHGLLLLTGGLFALLLGVLFGMAVVGVGLRVANAGLSIWDVLLLLVLVPMMIFAVWRGVGCTVAALTCFQDAMRNGPVLEITADGLRDYRSGLSVPWSSVQCARIANNRIGGVILQLRGPVKHWRESVPVGRAVSGLSSKAGSRARLRRLSRCAGARTDLHHPHLDPTERRRGNQRVGWSERCGYQTDPAADARECPVVSGFMIAAI